MTLLPLVTRSIVLTLLVLLLPLIAMLLSTEMQWGPGDFAAVGRAGRWYLLVTLLYPGN